MVDGWKLVTYNVGNSYNLMDLFKDRQTQFYLDPLLMFPASVTGAIRDNPRNIAGDYYRDADIAYFNRFIFGIRVLILYQIRASPGWFMGG